MASTSGTDEDPVYRQKVEADKRSLLEHAIRTNMLLTSSRISVLTGNIKVNPGGGGARTQASSASTTTVTPATTAGGGGCSSVNDLPVSDTEYNSIFGDDVDDSEEIFNRALERAQEEYRREKELK